MSEPVLINRDEEHLRLLGIGYYVFGGFTALMSCLGILYVFIGLIMMGAAATSHRSDSLPPAFFGLFFAAMGAVFTVIGIGLGSLWIFAGRSLSHHKRHMFCMVMAALICLSVPLGTVLGVFTLVVLSRPSVKTIFDRRAASA
ncbi:MAG: hypothetical protein EXS35_04325 [Pedosphaera sp.]|nr:hypothetical protein [Pedosphaera sp.]